MVAPGQLSRLYSTASGASLAGGTVTNPDSKTTILAISSILLNIVQEDSKFSEERYFPDKPFLSEEQVAMLRAPPTLENMFEFIQTFQSCARFGPECCIVALVLINRFFNQSGSPLLPCNWRPLVLCALMLAQKVWEDKRMESMVDYSYIYPFFSAHEINALEKKFLTLINFNVYIKRAVYVRYYFELRAVVKNDEDFPQPIDTVTAAQLDKFSGHLQETFRANHQVKTEMPKRL
ncbi:cyclin-Y-like protein 1 [Hippocampus zosterae]|uniref:cyclin-Y-like protein 1 n=1 Tax=Hippocampus zosterae TaxID=109293 RepID=UPI00223CA308|nr:cyclin-Y-like protein 1 [Hippocampus zosterae]